MDWRVHGLAGNHLLAHHTAGLCSESMWHGASSMRCARHPVCHDADMQCAVDAVDAVDAHSKSWYMNKGALRYTRDMPTQICQPRHAYPYTPLYF